MRLANHSFPTFDLANYKTWRKPLDASYRGLRTTLRKSLSGSPRIELYDTDCTVILTVKVSDRLEVWVTSPTAWEQVGDSTSWTVELWDVWYADRLTFIARKQRDDAWIASAVQKAINKGLVMQRKIEKEQA